MNRGGLLIRVQSTQVWTNRTTHAEWGFDLSACGDASSISFVNNFVILSADRIRTVLRSYRGRTRGKRTQNTLSHSRMCSTDHPNALMHAFPGAHLMRSSRRRHTPAHQVRSACTRVSHASPHGHSRSTLPLLATLHEQHRSTTPAPSGAAGLGGKPEVDHGQL